jgi:hypothetical protein
MFSTKSNTVWRDELLTMVFFYFSQERLTRNELHERDCYRLIANIFPRQLRIDWAGDD